MDEGKSHNLVSREEMDSIRASQQRFVESAKQNGALVREIFRAIQKASPDAAKTIMDARVAMPDENKQ